MLNTAFFNACIQIIALIASIIAGYVVAYLAIEELKEYKQQLTKVRKVLFVLTFVAPILFMKQIIVIIAIALSYGLIAWSYRNEEQMFFLLAPLSLFIATQNQESFFTGLVFFAIATMISTTLLLTPATKKKKLHIEKTMFIETAIKFKGFVLMTIAVYTSIYLLQFI